MSSPTVVAAANFSAQDDSEKLRAAMKGLGTDEQAIIDIVCYRSHEQLTDIKKAYQQNFGRVLIDDLKSELGGKFKHAILDQFMSPAEHDAYILHKAVKGAGTDEVAIVEVMCTRTNEELRAMQAAYKILFKKDAMKDLVGDTSGDFKRLLVSMSSADREEGTDVDEALAAKDAKKLFEAGVNQMGTDEEMFNMVLARRSLAQLKATFELYNKAFAKDEGKDILSAIESEFSGSIKIAFSAIALVALEGRESFFAQQLYKSMKGLGTNDEQLIRLMVSRSRVDLVRAKQHFLKKYEQLLEDFIKDDTTGDYRNTLMALALGNHNQ